MSNKPESARPRSLWLRLYTGVIDDPKVMQLSCSLFKTWVLTLCMAKEGGGKLPPMNVIAFKLRLRVDVAKQHVESLVESGLIDRKDDYLTPHNWDKYQYHSDVSTDRVKRFRKQKANVSGNDNETFQERPQRTENREQRTEKETDKEKPVSESATADGVSVSRSKRSGLSKQQEQWFDEWWSFVWSKVGRGAAEKSFAKMVRDLQTADAVIDATKKFTASISGKDPQYWPHPSTWLNAKRWLDEPVVSQSSDEEPTIRFVPKKRPVEEPDDELDMMSLFGEATQ